MNKTTLRQVMPSEPYVDSDRICVLPPSVAGGHRRGNSYAPCRSTSAPRDIALG